MAYATIITLAVTGADIYDVFCTNTASSQRDQLREIVDNHKTFVAAVQDDEAHPFPIEIFAGVRRLAPCLDIVETPRLAHHRVQPRVINLIEGVQAFIAANAGRPIEATVEVA